MARYPSFCASDLPPLVISVLRTCKYFFWLAGDASFQTSTSQLRASSVSDGRVVALSAAERARARMSSISPRLVFAEPSAEANVINDTMLSGRQPAPDHTSAAPR